MRKSYKNINHRLRQVVRPASIDGYEIWAKQLASQLRTFTAILPPLIDQKADSDKYSYEGQNYQYLNCGR